MAHNITYVHRRPCGAARATRRCGAPLRHMALRPGWAQGHVTYVRFVMRICANSSSEKSMLRRAKYIICQPIGMLHPLLFCFNLALIKCHLHPIGTDETCIYIFPRCFTGSCSTCAPPKCAFATDARTSENWNANLT